MHKTLLLLLLTPFISALSFAFEDTNLNFKQQLESKIAHELSINDTYVIFSDNQKIGEQGEKKIIDLYLNYDDRLFTVKILDKDNNIQNVAGKFDNVGYLPVLNDNLHKYHIITKDDFYSKRVPMSVISNTMVTNEEDLLDKMLSKNVKKNKPILKRDLRPKPIITQGQVVRITSTGSATETAGTALEPGAKDEYIKVKGQNNKVHKVLVIDANTVALGKK